MDILISAVGTGGTITGCVEAIKPRKASFQAIAVEPKDSPVISQTLAGQPVKPGPHKIQGTGAGFVPQNLHLKDSKGNPQIVECVQVANDDAFAMARRLAKEEGVLVGISTGANVVAAIEVGKRLENKGKMIVTIACSTGERYLHYTAGGVESLGGSGWLRRWTCGGGYGNVVAKAAFSCK